MALGTIVVLSPRGFGFIRPEEYGNDSSTEDREHDIFFHVTGVSRQVNSFDSLKVGDRVMYKVEPAKQAGDKLRAVEVAKF